MTAVRWVVEHPQDQLGTGGWVEYPDERTARAHAGTAATVWALVTPDVVDVLTAVERLTAERDQVARERDGVRAELTRTVDELDDARSTASSYLGTALALRAEVIELRNARKQRDEAIAERDAMRPVVEAAVAWTTAVLNAPDDEDTDWSDDPYLTIGHNLCAAVNAYTAAQTPGVDTGTSEVRTAAHGDAGPADGAVAAESDPLAEAIAAYFRGFVQEEGATYRHNDFAEGLIESLADAGWNIDAIGHPNTWALPAEPGPDVTAVRDRDGDLWQHVEGGWQLHGTPPLQPWKDVARHWPLTDATGETP